MTDTYLQNQNISNNIIINKPKDNSKFNKSFKKRYSKEILSSSDEENYETIDNQINDFSTSLDVEEVLKQEEETDNIQNFKKEQRQISQLTNRAYGETCRNSKSKQISNDLNGLTTKSPHLSRAVSGKIFPLQMTTNMVLGSDKKFFENTMECKRTTSNSKITEKKTESKFNSASENKYHFFHRKTVYNALSEQIYNTNKEGAFYHNNKIPTNTTKVIKINNEEQDKRKNINKNVKIKNHDKFKSDIGFQILNNNFNENINKNVSLSPSNNTHKATVTRITNSNTDWVKNIPVNILFNSNNNNLKEGNMQKNIKNANNINNFGRFSPKNNERNKNRNLKNEILKNLTSFNLSNSHQNDNDCPKDKINLKKSQKIMNENLQRFTQLKSNNSEKNLINNDINGIHRMTVPYKQSPDKEKNDLEKKLINDGIIKHKQRIEINPRIDFNHSFSKGHAKSKSPRGTTEKILQNTIV